MQQNPQQKNIIVGANKDVDFKGVETCSDIAAFSALRQKHVCFLSAIVDKLFWETQVRKAFNK